MTVNRDGYLSELYVVCLVGDFHSFLGHGCMPIWCFWTRDDIQELSLGSFSWEVSPYVEASGKQKQKKKYAFLARQADNHDR